MNIIYALFFCVVFCFCEAAIWSNFCCLKKHTVDDKPVRNVVDCKVQKGGLCYFDAIVIKTRKGRTHCYDPQEDWIVKNVVINGNNTCHVTSRRRNTREGKKDGRGGKRGKRKEKQEKFETK